MSARADRALCAAVAAAAAVMVALVAATPACKRSGESSAGPQERTMSQPGSEVKISGEGLSLSSDSGAMTLGPGATVPADFPKAVPIYPGAKVGAASRGAGSSGKPTWTLLLETPDDVDKVAAFYRSALASFRPGTDLSIGTSRMVAWEGPPCDVSLMIAPGTDGETSLTVGVSAP